MDSRAESQAQWDLRRNGIFMASRSILTYTLAPIHLLVGPLQ